MDRTPSDENADDDAPNKTPEPNPDELEDGADETILPPDDDGSSPDKNVINESESNLQSPPDAASNVDNEPDLENVTDEQEGAPEEEEPEESSDLAEVEVPVEEAAEDDATPEEVLLEANVEEVPLEALEDEGLQEDGTTEKVEEGESGPSDEAVEAPVDERKLADSIIEYIEEEVMNEEKELEESDSGNLAMLAEGIVAAIISSRVLPSATGLPSREPDEEMYVVPEGTDVEEEVGAAEEEGAEDGIFPTPGKVKMVDKSVQANAKEIDEALEALSAESLPLEGGELEITKSAESGITSEGEVYQSCEESSEIADEDRPCGEGIENEPCPYMEQMGGETDEEEGGVAAEVEDESQWEDLPDDGEEPPRPILVEGAELTDQEGEFEPQDTSAPSVPQGESIVGEPQDTYQPSAEGETPILQDEAYVPMAQGEAYVPMAQGEAYSPMAQGEAYSPMAYTPAAPGETYLPGALPVDATSPSAPQESFTPKPSVAPDSVRRSESSGGIKPTAPPADSFAPRAVASDTQRRPAAQPAVTPRRESREACEWQQAICSMTDKLFESPYNYICKFVVLCVAIRAIRNVFLATRCG